MSKTPRTDEFCIKTKGMDYCDTVCGWLDFAEKLETELADKDKQLAEITRQRNACKKALEMTEDELMTARADAEHWKIEVRNKIEAALAAERGE